MNKSSSLGSLFSILIFAGIFSYILVQTGVISGAAIILIFLLLLGAMLLIGGIRIIDQYDRAIVLTFGKYTANLQPGLNWIFPGIQRLIKVDLRTDTVDIPQQEVITKDNVTVGINAVVYFRVDSPEKAILAIQDFTRAVALYAQATLRDVIGGVELDTLLSERDKVADEIQKIVDVATDPWGIDVTAIKYRTLSFPPT
jgi:regulator of protease activity HflC (stomatin/prohibitin superfamily)